MGEAVEATTRRSSPLHHLVVPGITMQPSGGCLPVAAVLEFSQASRPAVCGIAADANRGSDGSDGWLWGRGRALRKEMLVMRVLVMLCFRRAAGPLHGASILYLGRVCDLEVERRVCSVSCFFSYTHYKETQTPQIKLIQFQRRSLYHSSL